MLSFGIYYFNKLNHLLVSLQAIILIFYKEQQQPDYGSQHHCLLQLKFIYSLN